MSIESVLSPTGIQFDGINLSYGGASVLRGIDFTAPAGKITVLFGPSGAGKTSCLRLAAGFERPSKGIIKLGENTISSSTFQLEPERRGIGYCFQEPALWPALSVKKHLAIPLSRNKSVRESRAQRVRELLHTFSLERLKDRLPSQLSGGEKKRLAFARAIAAKPAALLLDEPLASLEEPLREELRRTIDGCLSYGGTILLVTHLRNEALALADRLIILAGGRILRDASPEETFRNPRSRLAAELMGYRNFFPSSNHETGSVSPFQKWMKNGDSDSGVFYACLPEHLIARGDETGRGRVQSCQFAGTRYRLRVRLDEHDFEAVSNTPLPKNALVTLEAIQSPVEIQEP